MGERRDRPDDGSLSPDDFSISARRAAEEAAKQHADLRRARERGLTESPGETLDEIDRLADAKLEGPVDKAAAERLERARLRAEKYTIEVGSAILKELLRSKRGALVAGEAAEKAARRRAQRGSVESAPPAGNTASLEQGADENTFTSLKQIQSVAERAGHRGLDVSHEAMTIEGRFVEAYNDVLTLHATFIDLVFERSGNVESPDVERVNQAKVRALDIIHECNGKKRLLAAQLNADQRDAAHNTLDETVELMGQESEELAQLQEIIRRRIKKYQTRT